LMLIGEATHGTSEFYRIRARITQELIARCDFNFVAIEADWPDAARINRYVQRASGEAARWQAFARFPTWMWRNHDVLSFIDWLREHNRSRQFDPVAFYGLDLYSLFTSLHAVVEYLERVDPEAARVARRRYACLSPWEGEPAHYGRAVITGRYHECAQEAAAMLADLMERRMEYAQRDGEHFFDAAQNAQLVAAAERYYRIMYQGGAESWNLRDRHMFETLRSLFEFHGARAKGVVWAHNSHLGDAAATEMSRRGEINLGHLCRNAFGNEAYLIGQATDRGTVAASDAWDEPVKTMQVLPSHADSYERLCHDTGVPRFLLPLRELRGTAVGNQLEHPRLERAIGVIYRPQMERQSHYFEARLPKQFDELIWFDQTSAVNPLMEEEAHRQLPSHPFALVD